MKKIGLAIAGCIMLLGMSGCGEVKERLAVSIVQGQVETRLYADKGSSVRSVLEEAEISYKAEDVITPSLDTVVEPGNTEITVNTCNHITVIENNTPTQIQVNGGKVKDALQMAGVALGKHDLVNHNENAYLLDGMEIEVVHRIAVHINVDGQKQTCLTSAKNVQELLNEQGIALGEKDRLKPKKETELTKDCNIVIKRVDVKEIKEKEAIPFAVELEYSSALYSGQNQLKQRGEEGKKQVTYEVTYVDGKEEKRKLVKEKVIKEPVAQIVVQGTKARKQVVERKRYDDCDGSGHGYEVITWSDGTTQTRRY